MNKLRLSSVYLPRDSVAPLPAIKPFLPDVVASSYPTKESNSLPQALAILATHESVEGSLPTPMCMAIAVSRLHVITTRLCLANRLHRLIATRSRSPKLLLHPYIYTRLHRWLARGMEGQGIPIQWRLCEVDRRACSMAKPPKQKGAPRSIHLYPP